MAGTGTGTSAAALRLPQLQNLCKRDPAGHRADYDAQVRRLEGALGLLALHPDGPGADLVELLQFAAAVASSSYRGAESDRVARLLVNLLLGRPLDAEDGDGAMAADGTGAVAFVATLPAAALHLHRSVRQAAVSALILMRNKGAVPPLALVELFFRLLAAVPDKALRETLYRHLVQDVRNLNRHRRDDRLNRSLQALLHRVVATAGASAEGGTATCATADAATGDNVAARRATDMVCELYRRRVWTDDRAVAILASAALSPDRTVMCRALRFFLNIEEKMARDDEARRERDAAARGRVDYHAHSKKTAARQRHVERQLKARRRARLQAERQGDWMEEDGDLDQTVEEARKLYPAIELLRDPQGLAEALFKRLRVVGAYKFDTRLLMINFVTRLVGNAELLLLPLYPYLAKYLGGHQRDVTAVLAYVVQACHALVPPDEVYGLLKTIAHNFITERCSEEQIAVGINGCRAICARCPSVMSEEESRESEGATVFDIEAFARDLAGFANHRDRSVAIAAKSWVNFVRVTNPGLLQGKDRGLMGTALHRAGTKPTRYGAQKIAAGVEGADLLAEYEAQKAARRSNRDAEESEEGSDGGEDVSHASDGNEGGDDELEEDDNGEESDDDSAPELLRLGDDEEADNKGLLGDPPIDLSKMTEEERDMLKQKMSSQRIFSAAEFKKMRKLVDREERLRADPREAARRRRAAARGEDSDFSDDSDDELNDDQLRVAGAVNPEDIMAEISRRRRSKAERLEKVKAGRSQFESKARAGGSTNVEKKRKKNFLMVKNSREARTRGMGKQTAVKRPQKQQIGHLAKKRRRKM